MWMRIPASKYGYGGTRSSCPDYWSRTMLKSMLVNKYFLTSLIARSMGPTWDPSGANRTQVGLMLATWSLLSAIPSDGLAVVQAFKIFVNQHWFSHENWVIQAHGVGSGIRTNTREGQDFGETLWIYYSKRNPNSVDIIIANVYVSEMCFIFSRNLLW